MTPRQQHHQTKFVETAARIGVHVGRTGDARAVNLWADPNLRNPIDTIWWGTDRTSGNIVWGGGLEYSAPGDIDPTALLWGVPATLAELDEQCVNKACGENARVNVKGDPLCIEHAAMTGDDPPSPRATYNGLPTGT